MSSSSGTDSGVLIPDDLRARFPELIELIIGSESMNDEERQYWINILPIMTPDQIENLNGILKNERDQLKSIDEKYAKKVQQIGTEEQLLKTGHEIKAKSNLRKSKEAEEEKIEEKQLENVLEDIDKL